MYKSDILKSLSLYSKKNPKFIFYQKCIKTIENLNTDLISNLEYDPQILASAKIELLTNIDNYQIHIVEKIIDKQTNYTIKLKNDEIDKLVHQLVCITEYNTVLSLANKQKDIGIKFNQKINFVVSKKGDNITGYQLKNLYEISGYIFGIETIELLKYQRLDRIIEFINRGGESRKMYELLDTYLEYIRKYDWETRERIMVFSGCVFQPIGLTYTRDIDLMFLNENKSPEDAKRIKNDFDKYADPLVLANDNKWYTKRSQVDNYKSIFYNHTLPSFVGAEDIFEVCNNPKYNFAFMGIKFLSLEINIMRYLLRSSPSSFTDLIMLEKINGIQLGDKLCVPNMTVRLGRVTVFNNESIDKMHQEIKKKAKEYYNYDISVAEISKILKKCNLNAFDIYRGKNVYDPDTNIIKKFHLDIKQQIFYKYCKDINYLLDVGSGQLTDAQYWNRVGIKNVIGIEPSIDSIHKGLERLKKFGTKTKIELINGVGNIDWKSEEKYSKIFDHKYDAITFQYTLHYMMHNIEVVMENILRVCKKNTKVIILCMDGDLIHSEIHKNGKIEVRNAQEPIFAIYPQYDYKDINLPKNSDVLVYFKGAYGVASGSVEPLVDIKRLIRFFENNQFKLLELKKFLDYNSKNKNKMSNIQKRVSGYYTSLVFNFE
jgi:SAM-dependent methyltransferase